MENKKNQSSAGMKLLVLGAGLAGLAAAYFFLSPKGKKQLENTKSWAIKMKGDIVEKLEEAGGVSEAIYNEIVDSVATKYEKSLKSDPEEIRALARDLKTHWLAISRAAKVNKSDSAKETTKPIKERKLAKK